MNKNGASSLQWIALYRPVAEGIEQSGGKDEYWPRPPLVLPSSQTEQRRNRRISNTDVVIQSQQLRQIGGHQALEAFTSITDLAGNQIRGQMAIVKYGNDTILLQALAPSASWGKYGPTFKAMVASIGLE